MRTSWCVRCDSALYESGCGTKWVHNVVHDWIRCKDLGIAMPSGDALVVSNEFPGRSNLRDLGNPNL